jgi:predicted nucleotidyltransferase
MVIYNYMISLRSQITRKILDYFFVNPHAKHYINELAFILSTDPKNTYRKLKELETEGILSSEQMGKQRYFYINKRYPLLKELKRIFQASYGLKNEITKALKSIKGLREAYIFGSYAKENFSQESDIDILTIGSHQSLDATRALVGLQAKYKREFNIVDLTWPEFNKKKKQGDAFIKNIFSGKVIKII